MRREIQIHQEMVSFVRIPQNFYERGLAWVTLKPKPKPLQEVISAELIERSGLPTYRGLEVPGQFAYNSFPFTLRTIGYTFDKVPYVGSQTFWDIDSLPTSKEKIAKIIFRTPSERRGKKVGRWFTGIDNPEVIQEISRRINPSTA